MRSSNKKRVCSRWQAQACDAVNLGCLSQQFPELRDPRDDTEPCSETLMSVIEATEKIYDFAHAIDHRDGSCGKDHWSCSVGTRLAIGARKILGGVHGLELG